MSDVQETLRSRSNVYGPFKGHAEIAQGIKDLMRATPQWQYATPEQREALDMIAHKIGRLLNGTPGHQDSWHDIAGYATLVDKIIGEEPEA